jgi:hypothetical protein
MALVMVGLRSRNTEPRNTHLASSRIYNSSQRLKRCAGVSLGWRCWLSSRCSRVLLAHAWRRSHSPKCSPWLPTCTSCVAPSGRRRTPLPPRWMTRPKGWRQQDRRTLPSRRRWTAAPPRCCACSSGPRSRTWPSERSMRCHGWSTAARRGSPRSRPRRRGGSAVRGRRRSGPSTIEPTHWRSGGQPCGCLARPPSAPRSCPQRRWTGCSARASTPPPAYPAPSTRACSRCSSCCTRRSPLRGAHRPHSRARRRCCSIGGWAWSRGCYSRLPRGEVTLMPPPRPPTTRCASSPRCSRAPRSWGCACSARFSARHLRRSPSPRWLMRSDRACYPRYSSPRDAAVHSMHA